MRGVRGLRWCAVALLAASVGGASAASTRAAFPGRNGLIVFASLRDGNYELYTMQPDASNQTRLTRNPAAEIDPAWSPEGGRIAFTSDRDGNPEVYLVATDGSGVQQLTQTQAFNVDPTWSPDGRRIAFTSNRDGGDDIYAMNVDGSDQTRLTTDPAADENPAWSPDGTTIAFASARPGTLSIYAMGADGSNPRRLTSGPGSDVSPSWSPDGKRIAFASDRDGNYEIYVMNADGTQQTRLTRNFAADLDPVWSPDGKAIAFTSARDANYEIYAMADDGSGQTRLTTSEVEDTTADWQSLPIPPPVVADARFSVRWRESALLGSLVLSGTVATPVAVDLVLRQAGAERLATKLELPGGAFDHAVKLPRSLVPGAYELGVAPEPGAPFSPQTFELKLPSPREGVVDDAYTSTNPGGVPVRRFPPRTQTVFAQFRFAARPRSGLVLTVSWYKPNGRLAGPPVRKPVNALVVSYVSSRRGGALPRGSWRSVLRAGRTVVKRLSFRVG
jgi:dipeptidyl aminopeptidase/acylaminoacyl peptidase